MYQPKPLGEPSDSITANLAGRAIDRQLTIYAGAGLSAADPTDLPGASALAGRVVEALRNSVALDGVEATDLVAVADAISAEPMGGDLLRRTILDVADFCGATTNYAHSVIALLLCEGATTIIETNYDDCIERAAEPERPQVVRTPDEMLDAPRTALLKAHGCARAPRTMIITQAELDQVPQWAQTRVASELRSSRVAFVGIGSPADYLGESINQLADEVGHDHIVLVDPSLADWDSTSPPGWRTILPTINPDNRDARTAEEFLDELLRAYLDHPRRKAREFVAGMPVDHPQRQGAETVLTTLEQRDAVRVLRWMRSASHLLPPGESVVRSEQVIKGLLAIGGLLGSDLSPKLAREGWMAVDSASRSEGPATTEGSRNPSEGSAHIMLMMVHGSLLGSHAAAEARLRVMRARTDDLVSSGANVVVVLVGHMGPISGEVHVAPGDRLDTVLERSTGPEDSLPENLIATDRPDHLIDAARSGTVSLVNGERLIEAA